MLEMFDWRDATPVQVATPTGFNPSR